jgi:hypothetical protein
MAQIPLNQIPNAPDLASMSAPEVNNVSLSKVDLGGEKAAIASGYASVIRSNRVAEQNPNNAAKIGASVAEAGQGVYKAANTLFNKQQELNDNAAIAEFSTAYTVGRANLEDKLQQSDPSTWGAQYQEWYQKDMLPRYQAMPVSAQQRAYPDMLKGMYEGQAQIGHAAFQKNIADSTAASLTDINFKIESNDFDGAKKSLERLHSINGIGGHEYEAQKSQIQTAQQVNTLTQKIALDPIGVKQELMKAYEEDKTLSDYPNISKEQLRSMATKADKVFEVQQDRNYGDISSAISSGTIKSTVDLEKDPRFAKVADEKYRQALKESIADRWLYTPAGEAASKTAMMTVKVYPQTDKPAEEAMNLRSYVNENVPSIYRDAINKELDSKIAEMSKHGGKLQPETELIQYGTQRLAVARDGGVFGKFYSDKEVKEDSSGKKAKANIEILKQMEDVETTLRASGVKTRSGADEVIESATAAGRAKQAAGELGNQKGWFDFLKSRKKDEPAEKLLKGNATIFGTMPAGGKISPDMTLIADKDDPKAGLNPDTHKKDKNVQLASVNMDLLRSMGIDPKDAPSKYDVIVPRGGKNYRFRIGDNGPKDPKNVDFTPGAHLAMGTQSGDPVEYRVVPRSYTEG